MTPIFAEVFDKEPSLGVVWGMSGFLCVLAFALALIHRWGVILAILVAGFSALAALTWLRDPNEGPAIVRELGREYLVNACIAGFAPFLLAMSGFWVRRKRLS